MSAIDLDEPQKGEEMVPLIDGAFNEKDVKFNMIDPGVLDPVMKCIQGDYTGRFTYLSNCTAQENETYGEIIGGRPDYDVQNNPRKLTLYIEDPKLDDVHAKVFCRKYSEGNQFILKDMSDHRNKEACGVQVQLPYEEIDLLQFDYIEREFSVLNCKYLFKLRQEAALIDELKVWLHQNYIEFAQKPLQEYGL